jgi:hypothetical protein
MIRWKRIKDFTGPGYACYRCVEHPEWEIRKFDSTARSRSVWVVFRNGEIVRDSNYDTLRRAKDAASWAIGYSRKS